MFKEGYQYCLLNTNQSAISTVHEKMDQYEVRYYPLVSRVLKETFNQCPSKPRYEFTRDISEVLNYTDSLGESDALHPSPKPFLKSHDPVLNQTIKVC